MLAFVARRAPRAVPREELLALFWGERDETRARQSLRHALHQLRSALGDAIEVDDRNVRLADDRLEWDVASLEREVTAGRVDDALVRWRGELLRGAEDSGGEEYRAWLERQREALRRLMTGALARSVSEARERNDVERELGLARQWTALFPLDTTAHTRLVEALIRNGDVDEAQAVYRDHVGRLRHELDDVTQAEFVGLGEGLERMRALAALRRAGSSGLLTPDLVGRDAIVASVLALWDRVGTAGAVVAIEGEPGIGRTRLCDEIVRRARIGSRPHVVLEAPARGPSAEGAWTMVGRLLAPLTRSDLIDDAPNKALGALSGVLPELRRRFPDLPAAASDPNRIQAALRDVLASVAGSQPVLLIVDDYPRGDEASREALEALVRDVPRGILALLTASTQDAAESTLARLLGRVPQVRRVKVPPLEPDDVTRLLASMLELPPADLALLRDRLMTESGGVPSYIVELVSALADAGVLSLGPTGRWQLDRGFSSRHIPLPPSLRSAVRFRLAQLSEPARDVLAACAVLEPPIEAAAARQAAGIAGGAFDDALDELLSRRLLRASEAPGGGFEFSHELTRRVAAESGRTRARTAAATAIARRNRRLRSAIGMALGGTAAVSLAVATWLAQRPPALAASTSDFRLVVADFANETGNPGLDALGRITSDWLTRGLAQSGLIAVVPGRSASANPSTSDPAVDVARAAGGRANHTVLLVTGAVYAQGDSLRFDAQVANLREQKLLHVVPSVVASRSHATAGIETLRQRLLVALAPVVDVRLSGSAAVQSSPPSYESYRLFAQGLDRTYAHAGEQAIPLYLQAYRLDTTFTLPLLYAASDYFGIGNFATSDSLLRLLEPRRGTLPPYDRHYLEYQRARIEGDGARAYTAARAGSLLAPGSTLAVVSAPGAAMAINRPGEAVELLSTVDVDHSAATGLRGYWNILAHSLHMLGRYNDQLTVGRDVARRIPNESRALYYQARALAALGRLRELDEVMSSASSLPSVPGFGPPGLGLHIVVAEELRAHGHAAAVQPMLERALQRYAASPEAIQRIPRIRHEIAEVLYQLGRYDDARRTSEQLLVDRPFGDLDMMSVMVRVGLTATARGDVRRAAEIERQLRNSVVPYAFGYPTFLRARLAAFRGDREEAVRLIQQAASEGKALDYTLHTIPEFQRLRGVRAFDELVRPRG
jgi:tetratricopeptide (TPR) repeat protein